MSTSYLAPGVYIQEHENSGSAIAPISTSVPVFLGATEWGPVQVATKLTYGFNDYQKIFGNYISYSDVPYAVANFYKESSAVSRTVGGPAYVIRLCKLNVDQSAVDTSVVKASLDIDAYNDGASGASPAITVSGKYYGLLGNRLAVTLTHNPVRPSETITLSSSIASGATYFDVDSYIGFYKGQVVEVTDDTNTEWKTVSEKELIVSGNTRTYRVHVTSAFSHAYTDTATTVNCTEFDIVVYLDGVKKETWTQVGIGDTADNYFETKINNETTGSYYISVEPADGISTDLSALYPAEVTKEKLSGATYELNGDDNVDDEDFIGSQAHYTGMYAAHKLRNGLISTLCAPNSNAARLRAMYDYAALRGDLFVIATAPESDTGYSDLSTETLVAAWRDANGFDTSYGTIYFPRIYVADPISTNKVAKKVVDPVGNLAGLYNRVDNLPPPEGGVWGAPAGDIGNEAYARLYFALDVTTQVDEDTGYATLDQLKINPLFKRNGKIYVGGDNTLTFTSTLDSVGARREVTYIETWLQQNSRSVLFRGNTPKQWDALKRKVETYLLRPMYSAGAFTIPYTGAPMEESCYAKLGVDDGTMTTADIEARTMIGEIGVWPLKSTKWVIWNVQIMNGQLSVTQA